MSEALAEVKRHFGPGAVILNTRTFTRGGLLGLGGRSYVEITATRDTQSLPPPIRRGSVKVRSEPSAAPPKTVAPLRSVSSPQTVAPRTDAQNPAASRILSEVGELRSVVGELVQQNRGARARSLPGPLYETHQRLVSNAVAEELATLLVDRVRERLSEIELSDPKCVRRALAELIAPMVPTSGPTRIPEKTGPYVIALVGPTGVGKTTTVAKLAANFCLREKRTVGLVTLDTYRIGAVEQLKTYAQIINVPVEVVMSPGQLVESVERMSDRDVVLIDTAGRSQRDSAKLDQLKAFLAAAPPDEVHLVLSSAAGQKVLDEIIDRFGSVGFDRVIFTKLDEALGFGVILTSLQRAGAKLSYVTTGQDVPSDISVGESCALAELVLGKAPAATPLVASAG